MSDGATAPIAGLDDRLLDHLRTRTGANALEYASPPARILGGNETFVYRLRLKGAPDELAGPLVLRLYRSYHEPRRAAREARVQNFVAERGFPAPRVFAFESESAALGGAFVLMEELPGDPLLGSVAAPDTAGLPRFRGPARVLASLGELVRLPRTLARVELRLHAIDCAPLLEEVRASGEDDAFYTLEYLFAPQRELVAELAPDLQRAFAWLLEHRPDEPATRVVCHGDVQPLNILVRSGEVTGVVDWGHAIIADPAYEIGRMSCAIRTVPLPVPALARGAMQAGQRWAADEYVRSYSSGRSLDPARVRYYEALMAFLILSWYEEQQRAGRQDDPDAFNSPAARENLRALLRRFTGLSLAGDA